MIPNWNDKLAEAVSRRYSELLSAGANKYEQEAALKTGGFPVYAGWTGYLVITPDGKIIEYDLDTHQITEPSEHWQRIALVVAADTYEVFKELRPVKPQNAVDCNACKGKGKIEIGTNECYCGTCAGTGWCALEAARL